VSPPFTGALLTFPLILNLPYIYKYLLLFSHLLYPKDNVACLVA